MYITHIKLHNFKRFKGDYDLDLTPGVNILVGNNETGKSTIIEAIHLALSGYFQGRYLKNGISQYLFNQDTVVEYLHKVNSGENITLPEMYIEIWFDECPSMNGTHNSKSEPAEGLLYKVCFNESYKAEYENLISNRQINSLPIEYYHIVWESFRWEQITSRSIPFKPAFIDSSKIIQNASDLYISHIIRNKLNDKEKINIAQAYRIAQEHFLESEHLSAVNQQLAAISNDSEILKLSVDLSANAWEGYISTYLNEVPFHYAGQGMQSTMKTKLAIEKQASDNIGVILLEEPENHLSFSRLNSLLSAIKASQSEKQIIVSTHSSFVLNKLGLKSLILLSDNDKIRLDALSNDTYEYFEKLAGYETLRLILSKKTVLVEGDSDELVLQKAYMMKNDGHLPISREIDIMCVRGLSFLRYLEIAKHLNIPVAVLTDNDGKPENVLNKYADYIVSSNIEIFYDDFIDNEETLSCDLSLLPKKYNFNTLEPKILKKNGLEKLNKIFDTHFKSNSEMLSFMYRNKSKCALAIFNSEIPISFPDYIIKAIEWLAD